DYVAEMKSVLQQGTETLNAIVTDGTATIDGTVTQAKADITAIVDSATSDITTTANNAKTSLKDTSDTSINSVTAKATEATTYVDTKVAEFNQTVADNGFVTPEQLTTDLDALTWQKYKLADTIDGIFNAPSLANDLNALHSMKTGVYYRTGVPIELEVSSKAGFLTISETTVVKHIIFRPYNSNQQFIKRFYNTWGEWEELTKLVDDTGWIPYNTINGVEKNTAYKNDIDNGFDCAYRIIKQGDITTRKLRVNAINLTQGIVFAELPSEFAKNTQTFLVRTPRNRNSAIVEIKADGKLIFQYYSNTTDWIDTDYIYGEFTWHD